jgi:ABC-2 type transport system ATP-binding protein
MVRRASCEGLLPAESSRGDTRISINFLDFCSIFAYFDIYFCSLPMLSSPPAIEVQNLVKVYNPGGPLPVRALDDLSFSVSRGEIFGLLGPNGAGKTTLLRILTTLIRQTSGLVRVFGFDPSKDDLAVRRHICAVLQENAVELYLSVEDNLRTYARFHAIPREEVGRRIDRVVDLFGLDEFRRQRAIDLSGGMKRRVQVAKVFMVDRPLVFLDEATTGMDAINKRATLDALHEQVRLGRTIVLTTHMLEEAEELCDRVAIINHGRVIASGDTAVVKTLGSPPTEIRATFDNLPEDADLRLAALPLRSWKRYGTTVELTLDRAEVSPFDVLSMIAVFGNPVTLEVNSGSLEDALIHLLERQAGPGKGERS